MRKVEKARRLTEEVEKRQQEEVKKEMRKIEAETVFSKVSVIRKELRFFLH